MLKAIIKGRATALSKTLLNAGLLSSAALSTLGAGPAQAATGCGVQIDWSDWVGGQTLTCADKEFKWVSTTTLGDFDNNNITKVSATQPLPGDYLFNLDKDFTNAPFDFTHEASITAANTAFSKVDIDSNAVTTADPPSVLTGTYTFAGGNSPIILQSINGDPAMTAIIGDPTSIIVNNSYNGDGAIDAFQNSFRQTQQSAPGPLPLLGAGAAFGFSRRLRRRIDRLLLA